MGAKKKMMDFVSTRTRTSTTLIVFHDLRRGRQVKKRARKVLFFPSLHFFSFSPGTKYCIFPKNLDEQKKHPPSSPPDLSTTPSKKKVSQGCLERGREGEGREGRFVQFEDGGERKSLKLRALLPRLLKWFFFMIMIVRVQSCYFVKQERANFEQNCN